MASKNLSALSRLQPPRYIFPSSSPQRSSSKPTAKKSTMPPPLTVTPTFTLTQTTTPVSRTRGGESMEVVPTEVGLSSVRPKPRIERRRESQNVQNVSNVQRSLPQRPLPPPGQPNTQPQKRSSPARTTSTSITILGGSDNNPVMQQPSDNPPKKERKLSRKQANRLAKFKRTQLKAKFLTTHKKPAVDMTEGEFRTHVCDILDTILVAIMCENHGTSQVSNKEIAMTTCQSNIVKTAIGQAYLQYIAFGDAPSGAFIPPWCHGKSFKAHMEKLIWDGDFIYAEKIQGDMDFFWSVCKVQRDYVDQKKMRLVKKALKLLKPKIDRVREKLLANWVTSVLPAPEDALFQFGTILCAELGVVKMLKELFASYDVELTPVVELALPGILSAAARSEGLNIEDLFLEAYSKAKSFRASSKNWTSL